MGAGRYFLMNWQKQWGKIALMPFYVITRSSINGALPLQTALNNWLKFTVAAI
jgi:hypothetical protein